MRHWKFVAPVAVCAGFCLLVESAQAGGLYLPIFGTPSMGTASAGANAIAEDASTAIHNPAGMTRIDDHQLLLGLAPGFSRTKFKADAQTPSGGGNGGDQGGFIPISSNQYVHKISDRWRFGMSLVSISGAALDPDDDWARLNQCLVAAFKGRNREVIEICNELVNKASVEPRARSLILALLWLSGESDKAQITADQWLSTKVVGTSEFEERIWKLFGSQEFSARDLLKGAGESRFDQCRAHFYVGVRFLGENETEAKASFRSSSELGVFSTLEIQWARMLLHKLDSKS